MNRITRSFLIKMFGKFAIAIVISAFLIKFFNIGWLFDNLAYEVIQYPIEEKLENATQRDPQTIEEVREAFWRKNSRVIIVCGFLCACTILLVSFRYHNGNSQDRLSRLNLDRDNFSKVIDECINASTEFDERIRTFEQRLVNYDNLNDQIDILRASFAGIMETHSEIVNKYCIEGPRYMIEKVSLEVNTKIKESRTDLSVKMDEDLALYATDTAKSIVTSTQAEIKLVREEIINACKNMTTIADDALAEMLKQVSAENVQLTHELLQEISLSSATISEISFLAILKLGAVIRNLSKISWGATNNATLNRALRFGQRSADNLQRDLNIFNAKSESTEWIKNEMKSNPMRDFKQVCTNTRSAQIKHDSITQTSHPIGFITSEGLTGITGLRRDWDSERILPLEEEYKNER